MRLSFADRFWSNVNKTETCWLWTRKYVAGNRSLCNEQGRMESAQRIAWRLHGFELPKKGEWLVPKCRNKNCVRPDHLHVVKHGHPLTLEEKFWPYVEKTEGCWIWSGTIVEGRGQIGSIRPTKRHKAHRVSWMIHKGDIPTGLLVCHKCDNGLCVNPDHLFLGTTRDNMNDKVRKGRQYRGNRHHNAKLTFEKAQEMRRLFSAGKTRIELCSIYGVGKEAVANVIFGEAWISS